jgi:deferrochelatase/peroxidase EfeB
MSTEVNYSDVQGLVRFGYGKLKGAKYALASIRNVGAARSWLQSAPVANALRTNPPPSTALQVAFTAEGLRALGVSELIVNGFSHEFVSGMIEPSRSRRLGDVGEENTPSKWHWGGPGKIPHLLLMFFAKSELLDGFVTETLGASGQEAFDLQWLYTSDLDGVEPFSFADGISQPQIDWSQEREMLAPQVDYTNVAALGEFLLGYKNEYGKYTDRPLVEAGAASSGLLPAEDAPEKRDLGKNGTYLVMRQLHQDVARFWKFLSDQTQGDANEIEKLASAMVGRTRTGDPLVPVQPEPISGIGPDPDEIRQNQFTYDADPAGARCPFGAHVRRANPRNTDFPGKPRWLIPKLITMLGFGPKGFRDDLMSSVRYHRILRRGREYGPELTRAAALASESNDAERGLHFICLNANILRQFEFLQGAWIASTKFSGLTGESDPLLGNRQPIAGCPFTADFNLPEGAGALRRRVSGLQQFVTVRGGAYLFLPSVRALRYFAGATGTP